MQPDVNLTDGKTFASADNKLLEVQYNFFLLQIPKILKQDNKLLEVQYNSFEITVWTTHARTTATRCAIQPLKCAGW